jgi:S-adenosylmethionine synthetase
MMSDRRKRLVTSESVTEGHPDKLCDQISDALLDAHLSQDRYARVAVETLASDGIVVVAGEVTSSASVDVEAVVRGVIRDAGYTDKALGIACDDCLLITNIKAQSPDIAMGVSLGGDETGAGDQGIMYGYACSETENFMPLPIDMAHKLARRLAEARRSGALPWLRPDGKTQVTVRYDDVGRPQHIESVVVSAQHDETVDIERLRSHILSEVILPTVGDRLSRDAGVHINPTGRFVRGGPAGDTGLTGRKIMVDTYGGQGRHGGGAFSGKDPTKVDRSAAYMARFVAKNIVAAGLAERCELSLAYVIGRPSPEAIAADTFGTGRIPDDMLAKLVAEAFPFSVNGIIETLGLRDTRYRPTATYGHFGRTDPNFTWENTNVAGLIGEALRSLGI